MVLRVDGFVSGGSCIVSTIGDLVVRLKELPSGAVIKSFDLRYLDKGGVECSIKKGNK